MEGLVRSRTYNNTLLIGWLLLIIIIVSVCRGQEDYGSILAPMEESEKEALYSTIQGFVGDLWNGTYLYPDPCGWTSIQGVSCDLFNDYWYVTVMNIGPIVDNYLTCTNVAKFTHHLFKLKHLKSLTIFNCFNSPTINPTKIPISDWEALSSSLETLEFRSNRGLIGSVPRSIGYLKALQSLVLIENGLTGSLPIEIGNLVNLKRLVLAGNDFTDKIPESFGNLADLLIFDASRNSLSGTLPAGIGELTSLLKLDLSYNKLEEMVPREIQNLKNLTLLDLGSNKLSGELIQSLHELASLQEMVFSNNPIGCEISDFKWEKLQNLEILDLSNSNIIGKIPDSLTELKRLRFLGLSNNSLSGSVSPMFSTMPNLGAFYLNGNNLTGPLKFPVRFYETMGRRFGAASNPNLCYPVESKTSSGSAPFGVRPCEEKETTSRFLVNSIVKLSEETTNSVGSFVVCGFWWAPIVQGILLFLLHVIL